MREYQSYLKDTFWPIAYLFFSTADRLGIDEIFFFPETAVASSTFDSLCLRRTAQSVVGHLICFWDSRNINKNGEFMGITILLLDELMEKKIKVVIEIKQRNVAEENQANFLNFVFNQVSHSENFKSFTWKNVLNCSGRRQECKLGPILNFPKDSRCYFSLTLRQRRLMGSSTGFKHMVLSEGARLRQRTRKLEKVKSLSRLVMGKCLKPAEGTKFDLLMSSA
ncbi:Uncharacterized protein Rs2_46076 [Raphanus sativus]|nr:Uncharacterized protein Rs2_46076 [Raphanus sativus]